MNKLTELYKELAKAKTEEERKQIRRDIEEIKAKTRHNDRSYPMETKVVFIRK